MSWVLKWLLSQCPFVATPLFLCFPKLFMYQHMVLFACYPVLMWNIDIFLHKCLFIVQSLDLGSVIPLHSLSLCSLYFHEKSFLWQYFYTFRVFMMRMMSIRIMDWNLEIFVLKNFSHSSEAALFSMSSYFPNIQFFTSGIIKLSLSLNL